MPLEGALTDLPVGSESVRVVQRLTYGPTPVEMASANRLGIEGFLQAQLSAEPRLDEALEADIAQRFPRTLWSASRLQGLGYNNESGDQLIGATLLRRCLSKRQLHERLVECWSDHFNVALNKTGPALLIQHDRQVIRKHAMGSFPALLKATAQSAAMLAYLDNDESDARRPCQNYARELLELHTVGVNEFTQEDVREVARCLSGWTFVRRAADPDFGRFHFDPSRHDSGPKKVLGVPIPAKGGLRDGEIVLELLSQSPKTARRVALRLCHLLIGENPPSDVVNRVSDVYLQTKGDIKAMVAAAVRHEAFLVAPPKFKRPAHLFVSMLRAMNAEITSFQDARYGYLRQLGHTPFEWPLPNGYPDQFLHWADQLIPRWNFGFSLLNNGLGGIKVDFPSLFPPPYTPRHVVDRIEAVLYPGGLPSEDRKELIGFLRKVSYLDATRSRAAVAVALGLNAYQWA